MSDRFVYVTYIRTTPEKLWDALLKPEFNRQYWFGSWQDCEWRKGSPWKLVAADGEVNCTGEVVEIDRPRRLVTKWLNEKPAMKAEGYSQCTFEIEPAGDGLRLTVTHEAAPNSKTLESVGIGWPMVLSNLKSLLETGAALDIPRSMTACHQQEAQEKAREAAHA
ncbi:MAG TPA: SRPBCC family protein [Xanthobacteraceae bacterium]|nr:SRPBCC family protein [Xanthobacteraceae bacterium]